MKESVLYIVDVLREAYRTGTILKQENEALKEENKTLQAENATLKERLMHLRNPS